MRWKYDCKIPKVKFIKNQWRSWKLENRGKSGVWEHEFEIIIRHEKDLSLWCSSVGQTAIGILQFHGANVENPCFHDGFRRAIKFHIVLKNHYMKIMPFTKPSMTDHFQVSDREFMDPLWISISGSKPRSILWP